MILLADDEHAIREALGLPAMGGFDGPEHAKRA
jgi:hypothetical protein